MTTTSPVTAIAPLRHEEAMRLQGEELDRTVTELRMLGTREWDLATDCPDWDVRAMYQHVLGVCEQGASMRENVHQMRLARGKRRRHGGPLEAALSSVQVAERATLSGPQVVARLAAVAPRTVRGRGRIPSLARKHARLRVDGPVFETWVLGYLVDVIYLRDLWMHRVDLHVAVGRPLEGAPRRPHRGRRGRRVGASPRPGVRPGADRTAWPGEDGCVLYATDSTNDTVDVVTGAFPERPVVAVTPCGANSAPSTCSATPATPVNYLGSLNPWTGEVSMLTVRVAFVPQGARSSRTGETEAVTSDLNHKRRRRTPFARSIRLTPAPGVTPLQFRGAPCRTL